MLLVLVPFTYILLSVGKDIRALSLALALYILSFMNIAI